MPKTRAEKLPVPQSDTELMHAVGEIGTIEREDEIDKAQLDQQVANLKAGYGERPKARKARLGGLIKACMTYVAANAARLLGKRRSHKLETGTVGYRTGRRTVKITGEAAVIAALQEAGLDQFVRIKREVNRDAILSDPDAVEGIDGIEVTEPGESFFVEPATTRVDPAEAAQ